MSDFPPTANPYACLNVEDTGMEEGEILETTTNGNEKAVEDMEVDDTGSQSGEDEAVATETVDKGKKRATMTRTASMADLSPPHGHPSKMPRYEGGYEDAPPPSWHEDYTPADPYEESFVGNNGARAQVAHDAALARDLHERLNGPEGADAGNGGAGYTAQGPERATHHASAGPSGARGATPGPSSRPEGGSSATAQAQPGTGAQHANGNPYIHLPPPLHFGPRHAPQAAPPPAAAPPAAAPPAAAPTGAPPPRTFPFYGVPQAGQLTAPEVEHVAQPNAPDVYLGAAPHAPIAVSTNLSFEFRPWTGPVPVGPTFLSITRAMDPAQREAWYDYPGEAIAAYPANPGQANCDVFAQNVQDICDELFAGSDEVDVASAYEYRGMRGPVCLITGTPEQIDFLQRQAVVNNSIVPFFTVARDRPPANMSHTIAGLRFKARAAGAHGLFSALVPAVAGSATLASWLARPGNSALVPADVPDARVWIAESLRVRPVSLHIPNSHAPAVWWNVFITNLPTHDEPALAQLRAIMEDIEFLHSMGGKYVKPAKRFNCSICLDCTHSYGLCTTATHPDYLGTRPRTHNNVNNANTNAGVAVSQLHAGAAPTFGTTPAAGTGRGGAAGRGGRGNGRGNGRGRGRGN